MAQRTLSDGRSVVASLPMIYGQRELSVPVSAHTGGTDWLIGLSLAIASAFLRGSECADWPGNSGLGELRASVKRAAFAAR